MTDAVEALSPDIIDASLFPHPPAGTDWKRKTQEDGVDQLQEGMSIWTTHTSSRLRPPILKMGTVIPAQPQSAVHKHNERSATCSPVSNGGGRGWDTNAARGGSFQIRLHFVLF